jgi:hypothetical protein
MGSSRSIDRNGELRAAPSQRLGVDNCFSGDAVVGARQLTALLQGQDACPSAVVCVGSSAGRGGRADVASRQTDDVRSRMLATASRPVAYQPS